jgi:N-ethylmaleimide reductase
VKRQRFMKEVTKAVATIYNRSQFGIRFSPYGVLNDIRDEDSAATFETKLEAAAEARIGFIQIIRTG